MPLDAAINLVSVDDAAQELGIAESQLIRLERVINAVSMAFENFTRSRFKKRTLTLTLDGNTAPLLDLGSPIISITSVTAGGVVLAATDYVVMKSRGQLYRAGGWGDVGSAAGSVGGVQNVVVVGSFGYDPVPHDVVEAAMQQIKFTYNKSVAASTTTTSDNIISERIGDYSYTKATGVTGDSLLQAQIISPLDSDVEAALLPYRRWGA